MFIAKRTEKNGILIAFEGEAMSEEEARKRGLLPAEKPAGKTAGKTTAKKTAAKKATTRRAPAKKAAKED